MAYTEAVAHGLPVIGTNAGAIPDTVPAWRGHPGPARRCRRARCHAAAADRQCSAEREQLAAGARAAAAAFPTWRDRPRCSRKSLDGLA